MGFSPGICRASTFDWLFLSAAFRLLLLLLFSPSASAVTMESILSMGDARFQICTRARFLSLFWSFHTAHTGVGPIWEN